MTAVAGPSRGPDTWRPTRYLEPNKPDNEEVLEQAAYQAAITRQPGERLKRYKPRKTVDFMGGLLKWRQMDKLHGPDGPMPPIHPNPSDLIGLLPPAAHRMNPSTSICDHFIHTSVNKERSPTRVVQWTPDARRLLTGNDKGQFTLWNGASFNYESITQVHDDSIRAFAYSHNGQSLVSVDRLGMIKYFTPHLTNIHGFQGHREACHGAAWSPNDEKFVTGGDDGLVKIWSYREAKEEIALSGHGWDVRCVDWHPTKGLVVSGSKDMLVKFWDPRSGKDISTLHSHKAVVNTCKWNPRGHLVATAGGDGLIRMFDIRTFRELEPMKGHGNGKEINCLEWHPIHNDILVSGDSAGALIHWSLLAPNPSEPETIVKAAHDDAIYTLSFHPLGHLLCSGSKDFTARFWSRARPMGGHETDRFHLGEEESMRAQMGEERASKMPRAEDERLPLPGLPGLGAAADRPPPTAVPSASLPGLGGLPGLGNAPKALDASRSVPPPRAWGGDQGPRPSGRAPLPQQGEMLRQQGGYGDDRGGRGPPSGYGAPPQPPTSYPGPGYGQRDGSGGYGGRDGPGPGGPGGYGGGQGGPGDPGGYGGPQGGPQGPGGYGPPPGGYGGPQGGYNQNPSYGSGISGGRWGNQQQNNHGQGGYGGGQGWR